MSDVLISLGTRPEIIKFSPIIRELEKEGIDFKIVHSGQHYDYEMDKLFFEELNLPKPKYNIHVGSKSHAEMTADIMKGIEKIYKKEKPKIVLVEGDTNTVVSSALTATKMGIKIGHVEAGLRSFDISMPEEINRIITDHISNLLFAPTKISKENLEKENVWGKIFVTGNTIVDATLQNVRIESNYKPPFERYILFTMHRQENVDNKERIKSIFNGLKMIKEKLDIPIIYPIHPRSKKMINQFGLKKSIKFINIINPLGYIEFLKLEKRASLIITDSGGVQEEACILKIPCVTIRENTERPETVTVGSNIIAGYKSEKIFRSAIKMINKKRMWKNPFGNGKSEIKIVKIIKKLL